jgi:putative oxidoreductase
MTWNRFSSWVETNRHLFLDLVRIYLGIGLIIKGIFYLSHPAQIAPSGSPSWLVSAAALVPFIHIVGGALLAIGVLTRLAAMLQIPIVFTALSFVHIPLMNQSMAAREDVEFSALVLFLLVVIAIVGPGPLSLAQRLGYKLDFAPASFRAWSHSHADLFFDAIRMYLGLGLFVKGMYILNHQEEFGQLLQNNSMPFGMLALAHYIIPVHFVGGALLLLGFATRAAAISQLPLLLGAVFYLYLPGFSALELRQNLEFTVLVLFLLSLIAVAGAGRYSVDYLGQRNYRLHHPEVAPAHS